MSINQVFVTVGSTKFNELITNITNPIFIQNLIKLKVKTLLIQYGNSDFSHVKTLIEDPQLTNGLQVNYYDFKPSITDDLTASDLIICHGGSGTILEGLKLKKKLCVVNNSSLMDNHQLELIKAFEADNYVVRFELEDLLIRFLEVNWNELKLKEFESNNGQLFNNLLKDHLVVKRKLII
ncbi:glycosyltransferase family 1 protein [Conidiobolus coronatus NRRL 28638]|uniref:UDP-N-acetylglucosamine transferase subunit ALG13 n=1 Tax=Conidiobolus coronatus (strain ATCC 28846 / CBS 209.66 / NRRL 28638) TaxID=796925 RepID=A0A137PC03_CONC2|nr:glycosyltransferase family 1 protein [Conidiobolus coronatus NRRL 28638]|eukprot:KXN72530.1 glycosyltransferase family 1 protein [Conidiobolus coronatus NRRL 28638]